MPGWPKLAPKLGFLSFVQVWFISFSESCIGQSWESGENYDSNFIFILAVVKVRYGGITTAKIFKHGNYLK